MARLADFILSNFTNMAATPVERTLVTQFLTNDELFNIMEFKPLGEGSVDGNLITNVKVYKSLTNVASRSLGSEYTPDTAKPELVPIELKIFGGTFEEDRALGRAFGENEDSRTAWTDDQIKIKIEAIKNEYRRQFVNGNSTTNPNEFDGMLRYFEKHTGQVAVPKEIEALGTDTAIELETYLYTLMGMVKPRPNIIITTGAGKPFLQTINQLRGLGLNREDIGSMTYEHVMGIPIITVEESDFPEAELLKGIPVMMLNLREDTGIYGLIPKFPARNGGYVLDTWEPDWKGGGSSGSVVKQGGVEMITALAAVNKQAAALGYIKLGK